MILYFSDFAVVLCLLGLFSSVFARRKSDGWGKVAQATDKARRSFFIGFLLS